MKQQIDIVKHLGVRRLTIKIIKFFLRKLGIVYNQYYYMVNNIDYEKVKEYWNRRAIEDVKSLVYDDFLRGDPNFFTEKKLSTIQRRFDDKTFKSWGIVRDDTLIYSCWLSFYKFETSEKQVSGKLNSNESLMIDAYCHPKYRGKGLHGTMNAYRLMRSYEEARSNCVAIVLKENTPALKSQLKVGYKVKFVYYVLILWGKTFTNYFKLKKRYES